MTAQHQRVEGCVAVPHEQNAGSELMALRIRVEYLEQDLSQALHLFYCLLAWIASSPECEFKKRTLGLVRAKFLQFPQGFRLGEALIDLDDQLGNKLESRGVNLKHWVRESRRRQR